MTFKKGDVSYNKGKPAWNRGIPHSEETKRKIGEAYRKNRHKRNPDQSWKYGNTNVKGYKWITNLIVNRVIPPGTPMPEGFWYGQSRMMIRIYRKLIKEILQK